MFVYCSAANRVRVERGSVARPTKEALKDHRIFCRDYELVVCEERQLALHG